MTSFERGLYTRQQQDPLLVCILTYPLFEEKLVVVRYGKNLEALSCSCIDQLLGTMQYNPPPINRIFPGVGVEFRLQPPLHALPPTLCSS